MPNPTRFLAFTTGTITVDPGAIEQDGTATVSVAITDLAVGDLLMLYPPEDIGSSLLFNGFSIRAGNVDIYFRNTTTAFDAAPKTWRYVWWDRTIVTEVGGQDPT